MSTLPAKVFIAVNNHYSKLAGDKDLILVNNISGVRGMVKISGLEHNLYTQRLRPVRDEKEVINAAVWDNKSCGVIKRRSVRFMRRNLNNEISNKK